MSYLFIYWTKYHRILGTKKLHSNFELIKPSNITSKIAKKNNLTSYREWVNVRDEKVILHSPFNFATINDRQTRDKISIRDWTILAHLKQQYDNNPPQLTDVSINLTSWNKPSMIGNNSNKEVNNRIKCFLHNLQYEKVETLPDLFGSK